jgi:hypothetical protein
MKSSTVVGVVAVLVLWAAAGCGEDEHFPPGEGGGPSGGGGSTQSDAGPPDAGPDASSGDGGAALAGELCDVSDVREPLACSTGVDLFGIEVRAVGTEATDETNPAGEFRLPGDFPDDQLLSIGSQEDETRLALLSVSDWTLVEVRPPRVAQDVWDDLIALIGSNDPDDRAAIALYVINLESEGQPAIGATVSAVSGTVIFYDDDASLTGWSPSGATGTAGAALILSVPAEEGTVEITVDGFPFEISVEPDHLTWARVRV